MSLRKANGSRQGDCWACCCNRPRQARDFSLHRDELIIAPEPRRGCCGKGSCGNFGCCCTRVGDRCCGSSSTQLHLNNGCCGSHPGKTYKIQRPPEGNYENDRADKLFTVEVSSLRGSHKQKITIKAKSVQEKADWLEQLEAALRYRSDTRVVGPPSTDLLDRRKTAQQLAEKLNMQLMMHQRTNTQPTLDSWSVWRSASAAGRRALQQDDRDVAGEQLIEELGECLKVLPDDLGNGASKEAGAEAESIDEAISALPLPLPTNKLMDKAKQMIESHGRTPTGGHFDTSKVGSCVV